MNVKKLVVLAGMSLAMVAVAAPAAQAEWLHNHVKLEKSATLTATGKAKFQTGAGSYECPVEGSITAEPGSTGKVTKFGVTKTAECVGTGFLSNCTLKSHQSTNLPWTAHANTQNNTVEVTNAEIWGTYEGFFCPHTIELTFATITLTPNNALTASSASLSGSGTAHRNVGTGNEATENATASGSLNLTPAGTYGIR
jgi:hypothetical protein